MGIAKMMNKIKKLIIKTDLITFKVKDKIILPLCQEIRENIKLLLGTWYIDRYGDIILIYHGIEEIKIRIFINMFKDYTCEIICDSNEDWKKYYNQFFKVISDFFSHF